MRKIIAILSLSLFILPVYGRKYYPVENIPGNLKDNAFAVMREHNTVFRIMSKSRATLDIKYAVTVLDKNGEKYAFFNESYDKLRSLTNIKITIYDAEGEKIKKVRSNDIEDYCSFSGFSLYEDNRQKLYIPHINEYPYTVEVEYSRVYNGLFIYPSWQPVKGYDLSVQNSSFEVITPEDFTFRYMDAGLNIEPDISSSESRTIYKWTVSDIEAYEDEAYAPYLYEYVGVIYTAPTEFSIEDYEGNMDSWESLGKWAYKLLEGRNQVSGETVEKIQDLVSETESSRRKAAIVYDFVQSNTRYVSIQEGIGGWQPMPASMVDEVGYGDCKALSNYTVSLLRAAGVEAYYSKVKAGRNIPDINCEFVSNQSNHIIVCVPLKNDTVWLECTSQISPFGYIGNFTDDRHVLLVTEEGGKLVKTRSYPAEVNLQVNNATVSFRNKNNCKAKINSWYSGLQYDNVSALLRKSVKEREKWLYKNLGIDNFNIESFSIIPDYESTVVPGVSTELEIDINDYAFVTGNRIFIKLNLLNRLDYTPPRYRSRQSDVVLRYPFIDIDTVRYELPDGYAVESCPENVTMDTQFGQFSMEVYPEDNRVVFIRRREMYEGVFPAEDYDEFRKFYRSVSKSDELKIVLKKL